MRSSRRRYLADFSLVRVGIPESIPPPRLVIGFGKDRRTVDAVSVQDETVVYRYWLTVAEGDKQVYVKLRQVKKRAQTLCGPRSLLTTLAVMNVMVTKSDCTSTRWS